MVCRCRRYYGTAEGKSTFTSYSNNARTILDIFVCGWLSDWSVSRDIEKDCDSSFLFLLILTMVDNNFC